VLFSIVPPGVVLRKEDSIYPKHNIRDKQ